MRISVSKATERDKVLVIGRSTKLVVGEVERRAAARRKTCIELGITRVTLPDLVIARELPKLAALELAGVRVVDWQPLPTIRTLRALFLNGVYPHAELPILSDLTQLRKLDLLHMPKLTALPDLTRLVKLRSIQIFECKRLADLSPLLALPALREVHLLGTPHSPDQLVPLLDQPQLVVTATFGSSRENKRFAELVAARRK